MHVNHRERLKSQKHKAGVNRLDWDRVHDNLIVLAVFALGYATRHNLPFVVTSIIRPKIPGVSRTDIHSKGRAFDLSVKGWTRDQINLLIKEANEKLSIGAISVRDGQEREAVFEDGVPIEKGGTGGTGAHFHFQVRA